MSESDNDLLLRELGKITETKGTLGGVLPRSLGEAMSSGARFAARFLPTETYTRRFSLPVGIERALKSGFSVLTKIGTLESETGANAPYPMLKAVVGSGFFNLNPAIVYFEILEGDASSCEVTITAAAKEGLVKQHTAEKAVERIATEVMQMN